MITTTDPDSTDNELAFVLKAGEDAFGTARELGHVATQDVEAPHVNGYHPDAVKFVVAHDDEPFPINQPSPEV